MMRSLFSGVSGLRVHQSRMDIIGNNIANVNTIGFKSARMTFADAISQRIAAASGDNPETGRAGRNPMQVGLGANIGGIDNIMTQGSAQRTDRALDAAIQGNGFFVVSDSDGTYFTRAGNIDWNGNRFSIGGMQLMGWNAIPDPTNPGSYIVQQGTVAPLETPATAHFMDPTATTLINAIGNLNINDLVDGHIIRPVEFFDSIGNRFTADVRFTFQPPNEDGSLTDNTTSSWTINFLPMAPGDEPSDQVMIYPEGNRDRGMLVGLQIGVPEDIIPGVTPGNSAVIDFSPTNGRIHGIRVGDAPPTENIARLEFALHFTVPALEPPSVIGEDGVVDEPPQFNSGFIRFNVDGMRQQMGQNTSFQALFANGNRPGTLEDVSIGGDGIIMGRYSNGEMRPLGQIPLAQFLNPAGLERIGNNLWVPSANSGTFDGVGSTGELMAGTLEMSNVELSGEFTDMITTQRGFQANSRVITTGDELLQELVNLKR